MQSFLIRRLALALAVAGTLSVVSFALLRLSGDLAVALAGPSGSQEDIDAIRIAYGLDRPVVVQYLDWLWGVVRGDLGQSFYFRRPVASLLAEGLPVTASIGISALLLALLTGVLLGILCSLWPNSLIDRAGVALATVGQAVPNFWLGLMHIVTFAVNLRWMPLSPSGGLSFFILPIVVLAAYAMPPILRLTRSEMIEVLQSDFIRNARANGLPPHSIIFKHALKNALVAVLALASVQLGLLLGGSVVVESVFAVRGLGYMAWEAILRSDFPVIQAIVLFLSLIYVVLTAAADLLTAYIDPRIRRS